MKILILTNNCGGLYLFRRQLLERLIAEGHRVTVSVPSGEYEEELRAQGCELLSCGLLERRSINPVTDAKLYRYYRQLMRDITPDVVLTFTIKPDIYGAYAARKAGVKYVSVITGLGSVFEGEGLHKKLLRAAVVRMYRLALKDCDCLFFENAGNLNRFRRLGIRARKERLLSGAGVDLSSFPPSPLPEGGDGNSGAAVHFAFAGRIMREKGIEEFLSAAVRVKKRHPRALFHVCGSREQEYRGRLSAAVRKGLVTFHGEVRDMAAFYRGIHCVVLPSYHEGMSNVLQEASASARPVITSDCPGCSEIVDDTVTGYLVPVRDVKALTKALECFLGLTQAERSEMGRQARKKMEHTFDRSIVVDAYVEEITGAHDDTAK